MTSPRGEVFLYCESAKKRTKKHPAFLHDGTGCLFNKSKYS